MRIIGRLLGLALIVVLLISQALAAKNVIIMIGDGMGFQHVKAGGYYLNGSSGTLCFEPFFKCSVKTNSLSGTTDSAAAATALATGNKAANGVISQAPDGTPYLTALEIAKSKGKRTGLVSTVSINDATPAGFGAHEASRGNLSAVAGDFVNSSKPNVIFGGGDPAKGGSFGVANITQAKANGYLDVYNNTSMAGLNSSTTQYALGLFSGGDMTYEFDRQPTNAEPHLTQMATKAISILENDPDGFFIMIEGGMIDHASHSSDINRMTREVVEFNNAVQAVLTWMQGRNDTLLIITADHDTGGPIVTNNGAGNYPTATWTSPGGHNANNVPFYITGTDANLVNQYIIGGAIDNTDVFKVLNASLLLTTFTGTVNIPDWKGASLPAVSVIVDTNTPEAKSLSGSGTSGTFQLTLADGPHDVKVKSAFTLSDSETGTSPAFNNGSFNLQCGDAIDDNIIDDYDFNAVIINFGGIGAGDSNGDGAVDDFDFNLVISNFGSTGS